MRNTLSVVVPIGLAVDRLSALSNSLALASSDTEIILVNDMACEDSSEPIQAITEKYPRLNIQQKSGYFGSPGGARNAGLKEASMKFIYFADSDDFIHFGALEKSLTNVTQDVEVLIGNFCQEVVEYQKVIECRITEPEYISIGMNPGIWRMIFRNSILTPSPFSSLRMAEDQVFLAQLNLFERRIEFVDEVYYTYRKGIPGSLTSQIKNFDELPQALTMIYACLNNKLSISNKFNFVMFFRVFLTSQLRANLKVRIQCMLFLVRKSFSSVGTIGLFSATSSLLFLEYIKKRYKNAN